MAFDFSDPTPAVNIVCPPFNSADFFSVYVNPPTTYWDFFGSYLDAKFGYGSTPYYLFTKPVHSANALIKLDTLITVRSSSYTSSQMAWQGLAIETQSGTFAIHMDGGSGNKSVSVSTSAFQTTLAFRTVHYQSAAVLTPLSIIQVHYEIETGPVKVNGKIDVTFRVNIPSASLSFEYTIVDGILTDLYGFGEYFPGHYISPKFGWSSSTADVINGFSVLGGPPYLPFLFGQESGPTYWYPPDEGVVGSEDLNLKFSSVQRTPNPSIYLRTLWYPFAGERTRRLLVSSDPSFNSVIFDQEYPVTESFSITQNITLPDYGTYYWRVLDYSNWWHSWSPVFSFSYPDPDPSEPPPESSSIFPNASAKASFIRWSAGEISPEGAERLFNNWNAQGH